MRKYLAAIATATLLTPAAALGQQTLNDEAEAAGAASVTGSIPGVICTGDLLTIGLNEGGSFIFDETGFRFPTDDAVNESLAVAFFGEGWKISYKEREGGTVVDTTAYFQPGLGFGNAEPVSAKLVRDDDQECLYEAVVRTTDGKLVLKFTFQFRKAYPSVVLTTEVSSRHHNDVFDIVYAPGRLGREHGHCQSLDFRQQCGLRVRGHYNSGRGRLRHRRGEAFTSGNTSHLVR